MALLLKIVVGCLIAIAIVAIGGVAAFFLYLRHITKLCFNESPEALFSIHLHEDLAADWISNKKAKPIIEEFQSLGFTTGTAYTIEEMEKIKCLSFYHEKFVGVLYQIQNLGYFFDIVHIRTESEGLTVSTMPYVGEIHSAPGKEKIPMEGASVSEAFSLISEKSQGQPTITVRPEDFRDLVEKYYKEEQAHRNRNGGIGFDEFKSVADKDRKKYSDLKVRQAFIQHKKDELDNWNDAGLDDFFENSEVTEEERYSGGCYFIVPNKTDAEAFVHYLSDYDIVLEEHTEKIGRSVRNEQDIPALFERINLSRSPDLRAVERWPISFPIEGKIFQLAS